MIEHDDFADEPADEIYEECDYEEIGAGESEGTYCYRDRQAKPLTEQSMDDFDDFFRQCQGLSYIFLGRDVNTVVPNIVCALMLVDAIGYSPDWRLLHRWLAASPDADIPDSPNLEVVAAVRERVSEMRQRGDNFVLVWHLAGEDSVHVDCFRHFADHRENLAHFLAEEVRELVPCHC